MIEVLNINVRVMRAKRTMMTKGSIMVYSIERGAELRLVMIIENIKMDIFVLCHDYRMESSSI
jgi:hypothetical protein